MTVSSDTHRHSRRLHLFFFVPVMFVIAPGCTDEPRRGSIGDNCAQDIECIDGICGGGICINTEGDDDGDGLSNSFEIQIGTNPRNADSDFDGYPDGDEVTTGNALLDTDGDGIPDILESATADSDGDCIPDQFDAENDVKNSDLTGLVPIICRTVGACADTAALIVTCENGFESATCDYGAVVGHETEETTCDGIDNDCDGVTDDGYPDSDKDGLADCVDPDIDGDGTDNEDDNCPAVRNPDQGDGDGDGVGDACDTPLPPVLLAISPGPTGNAETVELRGEREAGSIVIIFSDIECATAPVATIAAGTDPAFVVGAVATVEGLNRFALRAANPAGLESACAPSGLTYTRDAVAPAAIDRDGLTVLPASPSFSDSPLVSGNAEPGARICFYTDDTCATPVDCAPVPDSGLFETRVPLPGVGTWSMHAQVIDAAGNASACAWVFDHRVQPAVLPRPSAPSYFAPGPFAEGSPNNTTTSPTLRVCGPADAPVRAYATAGCTGTAVAMVATGSDAACGDGAVHSATVTATPNGVTGFWALTTVDDGWTSSCVFVGRFEHDNTPPAAVSGFQVTPTSPSRNASPTVRAEGTEPFAVVAFHTGTDCNNAPQFSVVADANGAVRVPIEVNLNAMTTIRTTATDRIGNRSGCAVLGSYVHDDVAPGEPSLQVGWTNPTRDRTIALQGCAEPLNTVRFFRDANCVSSLATATSGAAGTCPAGGGLFATSAAAPLNATTTIHTQVSDAAGNVSRCFSSATYVHDEEPPATPVLAEETVISWTATTVSFRVSGQTEPGSFVQLLSVTPGGTLPANGPCTGSDRIDTEADANGRFTANITAPRATATSISAWSRDAAGNTTVCAPEQRLVGLATISAGGDFTTPDGPALLIHDPDGNLLDWSYDASSLAPSLSAMVFRGCFGSAAWMPELLGYADRRRLDVIELVAGDDLDMPRPASKLCRGCYDGIPTTPANITFTVTGVPANARVRFFSDYYRFEAPAGEPGVMVVYPNSSDRFSCVSGTPDNCQAWNFKTRVYAVATDATGFVIGYADAGDVVFMPGANVTLSLPMRADHKRFSVAIRNDMASLQIGFIENFMVSSTSMIEEVLSDYEDSNSGTSGFTVGAGQTVVADMIHYPGFGSDWGTQMGLFSSGEIAFGQTNGYTILLHGDRGPPPDLATRNLSSVLPFINLVNVVQPTENTRSSVVYSIPDQAVRESDILISRMTLERYQWQDNQENRELREWIMLQRPAAERTVVVLELPELLSAWSIIDDGTPEGWFVNSGPPNTALLDLDSTVGFNALVDVVGVAYLFALFSEYNEFHEVFGPLPKPFLLRASQLYISTDRPN